MLDSAAPAALTFNLHHVCSTRVREAGDMYCIPPKYQPLTVPIFGE